MRPLTQAELAYNTADIARRIIPFRLRPRAPRRHIQQYQLRSLQRLLFHAYANVALYRDTWRAAGMHPRDLRCLADLRYFPSVCKDDVLAAFPDGALAQPVNMRRCLVSQSSGSSGHVLSVVHRADQIGLQGLAMHRLLSMHRAYLPWHRFAYIYTSKYPVGSLFGTFPMEFIPTLTPIADIVRRLRDIRPNILACYPSHLRDLLAALGRSGARELGIGAISTSSEPSTRAERESLSRHFGCPVYDEYSTEELTRVAAECLHGSYHLFEDVAYVEIVDPDSEAVMHEESGEVVGTNLENYAMPFIRYRQGDRARLQPSSCACGWSFRTLHDLGGRVLDDFVLPSGRVLRSGWLLDASYSFVLDVGADIAAFRIEQETPSSIRLDVVGGPRFVPAMSERIIERFGALVGEPIDLRVRLVSHIPKTAAGKHRPIVCSVGQSTPSRGFTTNPQDPADS